MGKCAEFIRETTELGNGRAGSERSFSSGDRNRSREDGLIHPRIHGDPDLGGAAFGDPPVGHGDPGVKPGAFLPGPPLFFRSWREGHGLGGYGPHGYVWVLDPELPGLAGGCFALGSRAKGQGGGGPPPRGRCPTVVDVRTWVSGTDVKRQAGWGSAGSSSGNEGRLVRSTGTRSRAVGSQVRNDGRLHGPSLQMVSAALMTPVSNLSKASALSAVPPRVKPIRFRLSPQESPQRARPCPVSRVEPVSTFRSSLFPRAARAHLSSRWESQVGGVADVASVTTP